MISDEKFNSFDFYLKGIVDEKEQLKQLKTEIITLIKNIQWQELELEIDDCDEPFSIEVDFNNCIKYKISEIASRYNSLKHLKDVGRQILYEGEISSLDLKCSLTVKKNRIDMSGFGIPILFRGLGLGCKIYRAVLEKCKIDFVCSRNYDLSGYGRLVWQSLRKDDTVYTFFHKNAGFCFASDKDSAKIISILEKEINANDVEKVLCDEGFYYNNLDLIKKSSLASILSA